MSQYEPLSLGSTTQPASHDPDASGGQSLKAMSLEGLSEDRSERPSRIRLISLIPTLIVFVLTSGLGLAVLAWLFVKLRIPASEALRNGYLLVDEGVKQLDGSMESATLRALTATSFISTIISATSPILMALIAYRIAYMWVAEERESPLDAGKQLGPTPLQYGLLLQVLSASSVMSLYDSILYLFGSKSRARTPSYFVTAVMLGVAVYTLTHLVGLADLWLHATTSAVLLNLTILGNAPLLRTSMVFNESRCGSRYYITGGGRVICLTSPDGWGYEFGEESWIPMGQAVIANYSLDRQAITLADEDDLAIVVPKSIDRLATFTATTFGAHSQCRIITNECSPHLAYANCSNLGITSIPSDDDPVSIALVAPFDEWNGAAYTRGSREYGPALTFLGNPVQSLIQIQWDSQIPRPLSFPNTAVWGKDVTLIAIYALCNLTFYNVTATYDGRVGDGKYWSVVPNGKILSTEAFANTLAGPFSWQLIMDTLTSNIKSRALLSTSDEQVEAAMNQELSRLSLGFVSDAFYFDAATNVTVYQPTILGRYPVAPLFVFVALLFVYGLIALSVFAMSVRLRSDTISVPPSLQSDSKGEHSKIPALELVQLRLLSPLPLVAQVFEPPAHPRSQLDPSSADAKSVATTEMGLFSEGEYSKETEVRLRLGLEYTGIRPRYGIWKQE